MYGILGQPSYCRLRQYSTTVKGSEKSSSDQADERTDSEDDRYVTLKGSWLNACTINVLTVQTVKHFICISKNKIS